MSKTVSCVIPKESQIGATAGCMTNHTEPQFRL